MVTINTEAGKPTSAFHSHSWLRYCKGHVYMDIQSLIGQTITASAAA